MINQDKEKVIKKVDQKRENAVQRFKAGKRQLVDVFRVVVIRVCSATWVKWFACEKGYPVTREDCQKRVV